MNSTSTPTVLPVGAYDAGFINVAELYIIDSVGDYYIYSRNITVTRQ